MCLWTPRFSPVRNVPVRTDREDPAVTTPPPENYGPGDGAPPPGGDPRSGADAPGYPQGDYGQAGQQYPGYGYPSMPPPQVPTGPGTPGELLPRFGARVIDTIVAGVVTFVVGLLFGLIAAAVDTGPVYYLMTLIATIIGAAIMIGYFVGFESTTGQTLGKMALGLRTLGPSGGNPTVQQAALRNGYVVLGAAGSIIGALIPVVGTIISGLVGLAVLVFVIIIAVTISGSPTRQGKHDEMAGGTQVITVR